MEKPATLIAAFMIMLSDDTYGKVLSQTPELVRIKTLKGTVKSYQTADFLARVSDNHSAGFGMRVQVGVDYRHQAICLSEIPEILERRIRQGLKEEIDGKQITSLKVEFHSAGASSLDYWVLATFDGEVAARRRFLERFIQRMFVQACNENGWTIPFTQVTIHQAA
jgi:hypothetical protein